MSAPATEPRDRSPAPLRIAVWGLAGLALAYATAQLAAWQACRSGAVRDRIVRALEERLGPVDLGPEVRVDPLFRVRFGPLSVSGSRPGDPPRIRVESVRAWPDLAAVVRTGRALPAAIRLEGVRIALTVGARQITAGPLELLFSRIESSELETLRAYVRVPGGGRGSVTMRRTGDGWRATVHLEELDRRSLPEGLPPLLAEAWAGGTLSVTVEAEAAPGLSRARATIDVRARGLCAGGRLVGAEPIGPVDLGFTGALAWNAGARLLRLEGGRVELPGGAPVLIDAELRLVDGLPLSLRARADGLEFLRTTEALPPALALPAEAPRPSGTLDARLSVAGPLLDPAAWQLEAALDLSRLREEARRASPAALRSPFIHRVDAADGSVHELVVGPANPDFVPIDELPRWVVRAVTASEDAGFFAHAGFDFEELRRAAVQGAEAGRVVRGGSTITQQLAKNLYLSREKTLARKLREAMLTVALEASVPKQRLLEVYLNVAEWGPGIWGIGPAARHWFGKDARELTAREAAFLATVIPNPVRYHYMWNRGWLSDAWEQRVDGLLRTMNAQGTLTEEELGAALLDSLPFASPDPESKRASSPEPGITYRGT
jgi:hypothetical protein